MPRSLSRLALTLRAALTGKHDTLVRRAPGWQGAPDHWRRQGGLRGLGPPMAGQKIFFVKIEGLLEPVVLNLSFRVLSNVMFTSERRY